MPHPLQPPGLAILGVGATQTPVPVAPAQVGGAPLLADLLAVGNTHACARTADGVFCWGDNSAGELGNGGTVDSPVPVRVALSCP